MIRSCCSMAKAGGASYCGVCGRLIDTGRRRPLAVYWAALSRSGLLVLSIVAVVGVSWLPAVASSNGAPKAEAIGLAASSQSDEDVSTGNGEGNQSRGASSVGDSNQRVSQLMAQWRPPPRPEPGEGGEIAPQQAAVAVPVGTTSGSGMTTIRPTLASASSYSTGSSAVSYSPYNAIDGDRETGWQVSDGGVGEWIRFDFGRAVTLDRMGIVPGYDKNRADRVGDRWPANNRISDAVIRWGGGSATAHFNDDRAMQYVDLGGVTTTWIELSIAGIYHGSRWNDTVLSEISFEGPR